MRPRILRLTQGAAPSALGPLETKVMDVVWDAGDWVSVSDVATSLEGRGEKPLAYTTVKTILTNLTEKRHLRKKAAGKANVFRAIKDREAFQREMITQMVRPLLRTQRNPFLTHLVNELVDDDKSLAEFERLLAERKKRPK
jgi:predicted transcriptional regulator